MPKKLELLPFGADDTLFDAADKATIRTDMRRQLNLRDSDFVMITGGKIDARKNIDKLLNAFVELTNEQQIDNIKLILFGKPTSELKAEIQQYTDHPNIRYMEWISSENIHKYFLASDLAFFPGTHSVLWEEAIGLGLPCVFYKWEGIQHVDVGGNCLFIEDPSVKTLKKTILSVVNDKEQYAKMKEIAQNQGVNTFCYTEIAKRAIVNN